MISAVVLGGRSLEVVCSEDVLCLTKSGLFQKEAQERAKGSGPSILQEGGSKPVVTAAQASAMAFWSLCLVLNTAPPAGTS